MDQMKSEIHESDGQLDVEFESDTEIGEVTNWLKKHN